MKNKITKYFLILGLTISLLFNIVIAEPALNPPESSPQKILSHVEQFIVKNNIPKDKYYLEAAIYAFIKQRWEFYYSNKEEYHGRDFEVFIDDKNHNDIKLVF